MQCVHSAIRIGWLRDFFNTLTRRCVMHLDSAFLRRTLWWTVSGFLLLSLENMTSQADDAPLQREHTRFREQVAPVLAAKCVSCHRTDNAKGGLDLSTRDGLQKGGDSGAVLVSKTPDKSLLYLRVLSQSGQPPEMPAKGEPLSAKEATALRDWITAGASWPDQLELREKPKGDATFWSLLPVAKVEVPPLEHAPAEWRKNPLDAFIWRTLTAHGLQPSAAADSRTFIRRAMFDLLGLPPTPDEVAEFEREFRQDSDRAVERLIDRLLQRPQYGERWARHWLDIAHYADTHGFERDQMRPNAWRYRDYVIDSLNADRPYDQFIREQIAGDVIAPHDPQAVIATGFLAAGPWDFVGQVETRSDVLKRAARAGDLDDIVTQVLTATMGLTINCARCHDHKLDPITQAEYYRLTAVFAGVKRSERDVSDAEVQRLAAEKTRLAQALAKTMAEIAQLSGTGWSLADMVGGGDGLGSGTKGRGIDLRTGNPVSEKLGYHRDIATNRLQKLELPGQPTDTRRLVKWVFVPDGKGTVLADSQREIKGVPATSGHFWDAIRNGPLNAQVSTQLAGVDYASAGHSILGLHANGGITFDLTTFPSLSNKPITGLRLTGMVGFGSGSGGAGSVADFSVFVDQELTFQKLKMKKDETAALDVSIPLDAKTLTLVATDGGDGIGHDLLFIGDAQLRAEWRDSKVNDADQQHLVELRRTAEQLEQAVRQLPVAPKVFAIVTEKPPVVSVLRRGNPEDPTHAVLPGGPSCVSHAAPSFGDDSTPEGERRRRLAEWIVHPANPLTRRVLVNRLWHHHFGQGLVTTPSDFGYGGDRPSHPDLLDWLAEEALRSKWSLKHLHKLMMTSATYRQVSTTRRPASLVDASNRLLWRQNSRRLDAESLRDAVLSVTGKLNLERGGPGYRDFKYTEAYAPIYEYLTPDKPELWRRSIYRFVVRTTPHQFMSTLDCPDPANLTPARVTTTTALQALAMSNNEFMLQQSQHLAQRLKTATELSAEQVRRAFWLTLQRAPNADELLTATELVEQQSLFALCRALLNANEFMYLD